MKNSMDTFQDIDFSQLFYYTPVSNAETSPASSGYNNNLDKVSDFSPLLQDMPDTKVTSLSCVCENSYKLEPVSNIETLSASSGCNDILDENFIGQDFSPLFQDIPDTSPNPLSCVECVYKSAPVSNIESTPDSNIESTPVSNIELKPASSDCNDKKKRTVYTCTTCDKTFSRNSNLMRHIKIHEKKITVYRCSVCDRTFSHNRYLKQHMKIHTRGNQFSCEVCLKPFTAKSILKRHQLLHNTNEKLERSFKCMYCNDRFTRNDQLKQHVRQYENSTYTCANCNLKFCRMIELKAHTRDCHTISPKFVQSSIQNPFCEKVKSFKRKSEFIDCTTTTFENREDIPIDLHTFLTTLSSSVQSELNYLLFEKKTF